MHEQLVQRLGASKIDNEENKEQIFPTLRDALIFAGCLGYHLNDRIPLRSDGNKGGLSSPISKQQWDENDDTALINLIGIAETKSLDILEEDSEEDQASIFEEYINGGLKKITLWEQDNPGSLMDSIVIGLQDNNILKIEKDEETDDFKF